MGVAFGIPRVLAAELWMKSVPRVAPPVPERMSLLTFSCALPAPAVRVTFSVFGPKLRLRSPSAS